MFIKNFNLKDFAFILSDNGWISLEITGDTVTPNYYEFFTKKKNSNVSFKLKQSVASSKSAALPPKPRNVNDVFYNAMMGKK